MQESLSIESLLSARTPDEQSSTASSSVNESGPNLVPVDMEPIEMDLRHETILKELLASPVWSLSELRALTSRFALMPWACVARLNEWATEEFGDLLLEGDETITVNQNLKQRIQL